MSDNDKPYNGIKLSKSPESPKSLRAQEEVLRAAVQAAAEPDAVPAAANVRVLAEVQRDLAEHVGRHLAEQTVRAETAAIVARFAPWVFARDVKAYTVNRQGDRFLIELQLKGGRTERRYCTMAEAREIVDDARQRLDRAVRGQRGTGAVPSREVIRRNLVEVYGPRDREDAAEGPSRYLYSDPK